MLSPCRSVNSKACGSMELRKVFFVIDEELKTCRTRHRLLTVAGWCRRLWLAQKRYTIAREPRYNQSLCRAIIYLFCAVALHHRVWLL
jgi:hypothetical protein